VDISSASEALKEMLQQAARFEVKQPTFTLCFSQPVKEGEHYLHRTHPFIETLANYTLEAALDPNDKPQEHKLAVRRCGVIRTQAVEKRTTLLLVRFRYHIIQGKVVKEEPILAEECALLAFRGSPKSALWLEEHEAEKLLQAEPHANITPDQAKEFVRRVIEEFDSLEPYLNQAAERRSRELLEAHQRVRWVIKTNQVKPQLPPDVLGIYIYLPS